MYIYNFSAQSRFNFSARALLFLFVFGFGLHTAEAQQTGPLIRINAGTANDATGDGVTFIGDKYYSETSSVGPVVGNAIGGTTNDAIYQSDRLSNASLDPIVYAIPVPNGTYSLVLHFAETAFSNAGQRVFDVEVEGIVVLDNYDILAQTGVNTALQENIINVQVNDGVLDLEFISVVERAKVSAIEVMGPVQPVSIPFALNVGGLEYTSSSYTWMEDDGSYFLGEGTTLTKSVDVAGTEDDDLYESERFNPTLRFVQPGFEQGLYTIELHFVEAFHASSNQRIFDVVIEGETVLDDYDIFVEAGGMNTAKVEEFPNVLIRDGILNVTLTRSVGSVTLNAIAVTSASSVANESELDPALPDAYELTAAYPNPFNPQTQFSLSVATTQQIEITVFNLLGQRVHSLFSGSMAARQVHDFSFDAASLPSGIYLIQVRGERFLDTQQVILLK